MAELFKLPEHFVSDLKIAVFKQPNLKRQLEHKIIEQEIIHMCGYGCIKYGLKRDYGFYYRYLC